MTATMKHRMDEDQDGDFVTECPVCEVFVIVSRDGKLRTNRCPHLFNVVRDGTGYAANFRPGGHIQ